MVVVVAFVSSSGRWTENKKNELQIPDKESVCVSAIHQDIMHMKIIGTHFSRSPFGRSNECSGNCF